MPAAPGAVFLPPPAGVLRGALPAARPANQEARWRAAHSIGDIRYGDEFAAHVATASAVGDRDIHNLPTGEGVFVERVTPDQEKEFFERVVAADARILAISRRSGGRREMSWAELVERVQQEDGLPVRIDMADVVGSLLAVTAQEGVKAVAAYLATESGRASFVVEDATDSFRCN